MNYAQRMSYDPNDHIGKALKGGGYERDLLAAIRDDHLNERADDGIILDVGAHFGNLASFCAEAMPNYTILAFEPNPTSFRYLEQNAKEFGFEAFNFAVTDEMMSCTIEPGPEGNSGMSKVVPGGETLCVYLDDMVAEIDGVVDLIKIDVEGSELAVLRTATDILQNHWPVVICEAHNKERFDELDQYLRTFGYKWTGKKYCATPTYIWAH